MIPDDFLNLAKKLAREKGEAEARTAVSRAYYAAYHLGHAFIDSCGVNLTSTAAAHKYVAHCLQNSKDTELVAAGRKLDSLRDERNTADYRITGQRYRDPKLALFCIGSAEEISQAISTAQRNIVGIRAAIREHARSIMKLKVRGKD